jgi:hypothetical protein
LTINHGPPAIFANGVLAPPVTSFAASKSFCRSIDVINAHNMTLAGDASFNGGSGGQSIEGIHGRGRMNKSFGREVREKEMG